MGRELENRQLEQMRWSRDEKLKSIKPRTLERILVLLSAIIMIILFLLKVF